MLKQNVMNWLNQDWEHELQHTEMYLLEAKNKELEEYEEFLLNEQRLPAKIELIMPKKKKKKNENKPKSI